MKTLKFIKKIEDKKVMTAKYKDLAVTLFEEFSNQKIINVKILHVGYTNYNFLIETATKKFIIKIPIDDNIRTLEPLIHRYYHNVVVQIIDNILIKSVPEAKKIKLLTPSKFKKIITEINIFHNLNIKTRKEIDFWEYEYYLKKDMYYDKFTVLTHELNEDLVISHNDVNKRNMMLFRNRIKLIDYEWACLNYKWFDIINFLLSTKFITSKINYLIRIRFFKSRREIYEKMFIVAYFNYSWSLQNKNCNSKKYQRIMRHWYSKIK